jgi:hypothetical protein
LLLLAAFVGCLRAVLIQQNLDDYRAQIEQQAAKKRHQQGQLQAEQSSVRSEGSSPAPQASSTQPHSTGLLPAINGMAVAAPSASSRDLWVEHSKKRIQACLSRRLALNGCNLIVGLRQHKATTPPDWDDMKLSKLLYRP